MITHTGSHKIIARMTDVEWTTGRTSIIELWYIASNKMENLALLRRHLVVGVFWFNRFNSFNRILLRRN